MPNGNITDEWRGSFTNDEIHVPHAEAFATRLFDESECIARQAVGASTQ